MMITTFRFRRVQAALMIWVAAGVGACSQYGYRYHPDPTDAMFPVFADYRVEKDVVTILIDTTGIPVGEVSLTTAKGLVVKPVSVEKPKVERVQTQADGLTVDGGERADGPVTAVFAKEAVGERPWVVTVEFARKVKSIRIP